MIDRALRLVCLNYYAGCRAASGRDADRTSEAKGRSLFLLLLCEWQASSRALYLFLLRIQGCFVAASFSADSE